jgi:heme exporter protein A
VTLLRVEGAALVRGGRLLFEGLDLTLEPGEAVQVTGANGSGKTSMIRLVAGLLKPSAGLVERATAALADEGLALDRELPLEKALAFWSATGVGEALAAFDLATLARVPVRLLSTGQGRRARLARVRASGAALWLLDEPLSGLDAAGAACLSCVMAAHRAAGGAILAASHVPLAGDWREVAL